MTKGHRVRRRVDEEAVGAIILAGGRSSRIGYDKAFLDIGGEALIERQLGLLKRIFRDIIIVTNTPQKYAGFKSIKIIRDVMPDRGPLGGIYSGLLASGSFYNFVAACDMPFLNVKLIEYMVAQRDGFDVVVPRVGPRYETLCAVYSQNCAPFMYEAIKKGSLKIRGIFGKVRIKEVARSEVIKFGGADTMFMNVNTKKDLSRFLAC